MNSPPVDTSDAHRYARIRRRLLLLDLTLGLLFLLIFQGSGASQVLAQWAGWSRHASLTILSYLAIFGLVYYVVMLPLHLYSSFHLEHRFGLSHLTLRGWVIRETKQVALSAFFGALLVESFYALLRHAPHSWPFWATVGWIGFTIVLVRVFPTLILPIFYKTTPLEDDALSQRLAQLCQRVGLPVLGTFRFNLGAETRRANAALAGLGKTRRVLLSDTLLAEFPHDEIEGVLAHELAHHHYRHITKLLVVSAVGSWCGFLMTQIVAKRWVGWAHLTGLADIAGFPLLALWLSLLGFVSLPLQNGLSRYFEWQADHFAVATTKRGRAFADALRRLAQLNLADPNPPRWIVWMLYDHPPITERIQAAEQGGAGS